MAGPSPLARLLDRAGHVFSLAAQLGRSFQQAHTGQRSRLFAGNIDHQSLFTAFDEFSTAVLSLREVMENPPVGFAPVAKELLNAAVVARDIRDAFKKRSAFPLYLEFWPHLNTVGETGRRSVAEATKAQRSEDQFAFLKQVAITPGSAKERNEPEPPPAGPADRVEQPPNDHRELREATPLTEIPRPYQPSPAPTGSNPYLSLRHVLHELFWLAALARQGQDIRHFINPTTGPWDSAESQARGRSAGWGIPFTTFDPILTDAKRTMRELMQVAAGNTSVPFSALDPRYVALVERLQELANSVPADNSQPALPARAAQSTPATGAAENAEPALELPQPDAGPPVISRFPVTGEGEKKEPKQDKPDTGEEGSEETEPTTANAERVVLAFLVGRIRAGYYVVSWHLVEDTLHRANFPLVALAGLIRRTLAALHLAGAVEPIHKPPRHNPHPFVIVGDENEPTEWRILPKVVELEAEKRKGQQSPEPALDDLPERARLAFVQHRQAVRALREQDGVSESDVTDDAAHKHLIDEGVELPSLETWARYLREARNALGQQKKKPRPKYDGRSAVPPEHFGDRTDD